MFMYFVIISHITNHIAFLFSIHSFRAIFETPNYKTMATAIRRAIGKQMIRAINNASSHRILYSQLRFKCYLVGVDGSSYGYSALKTASTIATPEDKLISVYFPPNIAV